MQNQLSLAGPVDPKTKLNLCKTFMWRRKPHINAWPTFELAYASTRLSPAKAFACQGCYWEKMFWKPF